MKKNKSAPAYLKAQVEKVNARAAKAAEPLVFPRLAKKGPLIDSIRFSNGRVSAFNLYCVTLRDHPETFKLGRTFNWPQRSRVYTDWNLRRGDGILRGEVFVINEDYVDLPSLEAAMMDACPFPLFKPFEWFVGDNSEACNWVDRFLTASEMTFERLDAKR